MAINNAAAVDAIKSVMGLDIGNGYACPAFLPQEGGDPIILLNDELRSAGLPAVCYVDDQREIHVGAGVQDQIARQPHRAIHCVKQHLAYNDVVLRNPKNGKTITVSSDDAYAAIAAEALAMANHEREAIRRESIYQLVLTYPVEFRDTPQRIDRMKRAVEAIPLENGHAYEVIACIPEPAAAAFDYLYYMRNLAPEDRRITQDSFTALVFDLGHGTLDMALVSAGIGNEYKVYASEGLPDIGGSNFDRIIVNEFLASLKRNHGCSVLEGSPAMERLRRIAVRCKHVLSDETIFEDDTSFIINGEYLTLSLSRERFEVLSEGLMQPALERAGSMLDYARSSGLKVDCIVLSGGASRMPMVYKGLERLAAEYGIYIEMHRPASAVAFGAARFAQQMAGTSKRCNAGTLKQTAEFSFGLSRRKEGSLYDEIVFVLPASSVLPAKSVPVVEFEAERSGMLNVIIARSKVHGMDEKTDADPADCWELARFPFELKPYQPCLVSFELGISREITVRVTTGDGKVQEKTTMLRAGSIH